MKDGFLRVAAATPSIRVADCRCNAEKILEKVLAAPSDTAVLVFPELCITGYTCGDLFLQPTLLQEAEAALTVLLRKTAALDTVILVGLPVAEGAALYNCAAVMQKGRLLGLVPKQNIPTYSEFYEGRHFTAGNAVPHPISFAGQETQLGAAQIFICREMPQLRLGVEICEDLWVGEQPSQKLAAAGATVIANLSASDESIGKGAYRRNLVSMQSARLSCAYIYADAGAGESTTDLIFSGHDLIAENGVILAESRRFTTDTVVADIDLERLLFERRRISTCQSGAKMTEVSFSFPLRPLTLTRRFAQYPFVPQSEQDRAARAEEILTMQATGLASRLAHTHARTVVGLSGGLDSALALLVICRAYDLLGLERRDIHTVTMPCFGTTGRTLGNARTLASATDSTLHEIDITVAVRQHLADIGHREDAYDVTYENAQARERTQVLMDVANQYGALVIGTGDLSELALGWATYNGDHMSMYGVNASVPKTLVRYLVEYEARRIGGAAGAALTDILDTPVSPELLPPKDGEISQQTEELVGPYMLHDFFLYYMVRFGYPPRKIYRIACLTFTEVEPAVILHWLKTFVRRFFAQQFKRSCLPDGPKVGSVTLSPRGDWRMPSDAVAALWLQQLEDIED